MASGPASAHIVASGEAVPNISGPLELSISTDTPSVCAYGLSTCPPVGPTVRVHLSATSPPLRTAAAQRVEVLYLLDVSPFTTGSSGILSLPGGTQAVDTFRASAGSIAQALQSRYPTVNLTFGLAASEGTGGSYDDGDNFSYAVFVGNFTNSSQFGPAVNRSFSNPGDVDGSDNRLQSSVITALFGALSSRAGSPGWYWSHSSVVNWTPTASHVIVWLGGTAPQDPNYTENMCPFGQGASRCDGPLANRTMPACEPYTNFSGGPLPDCEGWLRSPAGIPLGSIAALSRAGLACRNSTYGHCTIDSIIVNATSTDAASSGWNPSNSSALSRAIVANDTHHVVNAGCDIANATGGSWDGPLSSKCGPVNGTLGYTAGVSDPELLRAFDNISLGAPVRSPVVASPVPGSPMFQFVTTPWFAPAPSLNSTSTCTTSQSIAFSCPGAPALGIENGRTVLAWNWSTDPGHSAMMAGDTWSASFDLVATGGPANATPIDQCTTPECLRVENNPGIGPVSGAEYAPWGLVGPLNQSFPVAEVSVVPHSRLSVHLAMNPAVAEAPSIVGFALTTSGGVAPFNVSWAFGDGNLEDTSALGVEHTYSTAGSYRVTVRIQDAVGELANLSQSVSILPALQANVTPVATSGGAPLVVEFRANPEGGLAPYSVRWDFGNGSTANGTSVVFSFLHSGMYTVQVRVTDSLNTTRNVTVPVSVGVGVSGLPPPVVANAVGVFGALPTCHTGPPAYVQFSGNATGGTPPYAYTWNFGDGTFGSGAVVDHSFSPPSPRVHVVLTVTDSNGTVGSTNVTSIYPPAEYGPACPPREGTGLVPLWAVGVSLTGVVAIAIAIVVVFRRRR
jgi:PKD repeat protein